MCGIAAVFARSGASGAATAITRSLGHRGPDDCGGVALTDPHGAPAGYLGHRRLSVLDLSAAGHQPMAWADGRYVVTYNGEIYNFRALRAELEARGCRFTSESDTEVLLAGWAALGPAFLARLRGMFAFALWDSTLGRGYLVRDRFGIKPLYTAVRPGMVAAASELRALIASGVASRQLSTDAIGSYLASGSVAEPYAITDGIRAVRPGHWIEIAFDRDQPQLGPERPFAEIPVRCVRASNGSGGTNEHNAPLSIRAALRDSIAAHLVSDVEVGVFLSGGIDSAALVALASEVSPRPLRTFTVRFAEDGFSEGRAAEDLARHFGTVHESVLLSDAEMLDNLDEAMAAMDQPSMDGINVYHVSRAVRERGIKVALSGLGGDELFAGYPSFARARRGAIWWRGPVGGLARRAMAGVLRRRSGVRAEKAGLWLGGRTTASGAYLGSRALFGPRTLRELHSRPAAPLIAPPAGATPAAEVSWYELTGYMRNTLLRDADVFSMAHALELRVPFVDEPVARAVAAIDESLLFSGRGPKPLLRLALADLLPAGVWDRPKQGFTLPFAVWMRGTLRDAVERELAGEGADRCGIPVAAARRVMDLFLARRISWSRPWALYTLFRWAREHDVALASVDRAA